MGTFLKKNLKKMIIIVIILAIVVFIFSKCMKISTMPPMVSTAIVTREDLLNTVDVTGTVESESTKKIYTKVTLPVETNMVEVGDVVKEGDILCQLDTTKLYNSIAEQSASASASAAVNNNRIEQSKKEYERAKEDIKGEKNAQLLQAEQTLERAKQALEQAEISLDGAINNLQNGRNETKDGGFSNIDTDKTMDPLVNARDAAYARYEAAKEDVTNAEESLKVVKNSIRRDLERQQDNIVSNEVAAGSTYASWVTISNIEKDIANATITSPISGVVTAVYVTEGETVNGLLYVIEDVNQLKISTMLKEYDLSLVKKGDSVEIKSDVTGEKTFEGSVDMISPTTKKDTKGDSANSNSGEFETKIKVKGKASDLRIGSKARVKILYDKRENVISVPYEALVTKQEGENPEYSVFIVDNVGENGIAKVKEVPVTLGMQTNFKIEITSDNLKEGDQILLNTQGIIDGAEVMIMQDGAVNDGAVSGGGSVQISM